MDKSKKVPLYKAFEEDLKNPEFVLPLINEYLEENNAAAFLSLLRDISKANQVNMSELSRTLDMDRRNLYRVLSGEGNPTWTTLSGILDALGFQLSVQIKDAS